MLTASPPGDMPEGTLRAFFCGCWNVAMGLMGDAGAAHQTLRWLQVPMCRGRGGQREGRGAGRGRGEGAEGVA